MASGRIGQAPGRLEVVVGTELRNLRAFHVQLLSSVELVGEHPTSEAGKSFDESLWWLSLIRATFVGDDFIGFSSVLPELEPPAGHETPVLALEFVFRGHN